MKGKIITKKNMNKYDWGKRIFMGVGAKWVYYRVPLKKTGKYEYIKMFYDRNEDWEFEHE